MTIQGGYNTKMHMLRKILLIFNDLWVVVIFKYKFRIKIAETD